MALVPYEADPFSAVASGASGEPPLLFKESVEATRKLLAGCGEGGVVYTSKTDAC
jgi:hypothetical protein